MVTVRFFILISFRSTTNYHLIKELFNTKLIKVNLEKLTYLVIYSDGEVHDLFIVNLSCYSV